jgi:opacity protein-like surface antigen
VIRLLPILALALAGTAAQAADKGIYLGVGVTQAQIDGIAPDFDLDDTGFKLIVGFRPLDLFAVEANYIDLGSDNADVLGFPVEVDGKAYAGFGLLFLALPFVDLYAKAGLAHWELDGSVSGLGSASDSDTEFAYGAGVQVRFLSLGVRLEYESFDIQDTDGADLITLGFTYTFL